MTSDNDIFALNFIGAFECACPRGFRQMGDRCVDVDECVEQQGEQNSIQFWSEKQLISANNIFFSFLGLCPRPGNCKNTHGSFKCVCPRGYKLDQSGTFCEDR